MAKQENRAWKIVDIEFGDQRKLTDTLLNEITNLKPIKDDSNSLSRYAARILRFVNNMKQNGCAVTSTSEAPFVMSQLLSKWMRAITLNLAAKCYAWEKKQMF